MTVRYQPPVLTDAVAGGRVMPRHAAFLDGDLHGRPGAFHSGPLRVLGDRPVQVGVQFSLGGLVADLPCRRDEPPAGRLDAADHFALDVDVAEQAIEALRDDGDSLTGLDGLDGGLELRPVGEQRATGDGPDAAVDVDVLVPDVSGVYAEPVRGCFPEDGAGLDFGRVPRVVVTLADADDPDGPVHLLRKVAWVSTLGGSCNRTKGRPCAASDS
jgi:hypothetical protein